MTAQRRRLVLATLAYLALSLGGQFVLVTTPFELHRTVTSEVRLWNLVADALWLVAMLLLMVRQPTSRLWVIILVWTAVNQVWLIGYLDVPRPIVDLPNWLLGELWAAVFVHLVVAYPSGRVTGRFDRSLVGAVYAVAIGVRVLGLVVGPDSCSPICDNPIRALPFGARLGRHPVRGPRGSRSSCCSPRSAWSSGTGAMPGRPAGGSCCRW